MKNKNSDKHNDNKANDIGVPFLFIFASLVFILGAKPNTAPQPSSEKYADQLLSFIESCAEKTADTMDATTCAYTNIESARRDSAFYADLIKHIMKKNGNFVSQTEKPIFIGDVAPAGYKQENIIDLEQMNKNDELKQAARGYNDAVASLIVQKRKNTKTY